MTDDIAAMVDAARERAFVGRSTEIACFRAALDGDASRRVLFVHGVGGLGKTALLQRFRAIAHDAGCPVVTIDGEDVGGSPEALRAALDAGRPGCGKGGARTAPWVLQIDAYERLSSIDDWVRERLLGTLPAQVVVVIAGRQPPSTGWLTDLGWRSVVASLPLTPLGEEQSLLLLERAGAPDAARQRLAALGHGHPLTLAMLAAAARAGTLPGDLADAPDLVAALAARVVDETPDDDHALAVALCAHAWLTTQDLIDDLLGRPAPEIWAWLETRAWVTRGTYGVYPHDLVRDVLAANQRRRTPSSFRLIHRFLHAHSWAALRSADENERRIWAHQKLFLHYGSPLASSFWTLRSRGAVVVTAGRPSDHTEVLAIVQEHRGREDAEVARCWLASQPENLSVARSASGLDAFIFHALCAGDDLPVDDEITRAALAYATRTAPPRPGELISVARFLGGRHGDQRDPYAVVVGSVSSTILWCTRPLAWSFVASPDPEFWGPAFAYLALSTAFEAEFAGCRYTMYAIDWRRLTPERWFELMGERELTGETGPAPDRLLNPAPLSRPAFGEAVRSALRDLHRPDQLRSNPLLTSRVGAGMDDPEPERLRAVLVAGIETLDADPRDHHLSRVLDRTYLHAAPTQEAAAEVLDLPFSTYRRHLARALDRLSDLLWSIEIGDRAPLQTSSS